MIWPSSSWRTYDARAVQDAGLAGGEGGRVLAGLDAVSGGLAADEPYAGVGDEGVEEADGVGAAADAGDRGVGQPAGPLQELRRASTPMTRWKSRTIAGKGCGPATVPNR